MLRQIIIISSLQRKTNSKNPRLLWKRSSIPCVFCLYTLLKVVCYYDLNVLSMSVMSFRRKKFGGWVGEVSSIQVFLDFQNFFNFAKSQYKGVLPVPLFDTLVINKMLL